jgi:hypothetical protein
MRRLRAFPLALAVALACAGGETRPPPPPTGLSVADARAVLARFSGAVEAGRWDDAHVLLSARWRARYTPGRLATDWRGSGAVGPEAAARVGRALAAGAAPRVEGARAVLAVDGGRAAVLAAEDGGWRVEALE